MATTKTAIPISPQVVDTKKRPFTSRTEKISSKSSSPPSSSSNSPKSASTPKQRIRYNNSQSSSNSNKGNSSRYNKKDSTASTSPTPSDKTDSERSPSSVMLLSPGENSEQQGSIEQAIKSIEEQIKAEQNKITRNILRKQQKQIRYNPLSSDSVKKDDGNNGNNENTTTTTANTTTTNNSSSIKVKSSTTLTKQSTTATTNTTTKRSQTMPPLPSSSSSSSSSSTKRTCTCGDLKNTWCFVCEMRRFKSDFPKWTSGNKIIDNFIREIQLFSSSETNYIEWIPYDRLKEIKFIGEGTYASLSSAVWLDGPRNFLLDAHVGGSGSSTSIKKVKRDSKKKVVLKQLHNSKDIIESYLIELNKYYKKISWNNSIMQIYGISKDPSTKNFIIIYEYVEHGDLNNYLYENSLNMGWSLKLALICDISRSLKTLHGANLIHRDIHSGNVLILKDGSTALTDFGICKHVDKNNKLEPGKVEGVLPFMSPEVIKKQTYSKKSDIYSFAMLMWEISANGKRPFQERAHDEELALEICQGLRPKPVAGTPPCWIQLMEKCWDDDPQKRPDAEIIHRTLLDWLKKLVETPKLPYKVNTEFTLAETWRVRGQHQHSPSITSTNNSDTPVVMAEEGGMKVDSALVLGISSGNGEFQHPMAFYTSQLFDFRELDFEKPIAQKMITESSQIQGSSSHEGGGSSSETTTVVEESSQEEQKEQPQQKERDSNNINGIELLPIPVIATTISTPLKKLTINTLRNNSPEEEGIGTSPNSEEAGSPTTPIESDENAKNLSASKINVKPEYPIEVEF